MTLNTWLRAFLPGRMRVPGHERWRGALGAALGLALAGWLDQRLGTALLPAGLSPDTWWLVAPLGASAVLVFAVPASPMAQPWAVVGGNSLSALVGVGYAFIMPGWAALVTGRLPEAERPAAWGALMTVENVGTSLGPLVGAFAYRTLGPTGPFITGASLALLTALGYVVFRHLLTTRHETGLEGGA